MIDGEPAPATAGGLLRAARERQGLHIAALAAAIKVAPRKLEALEGDRHEELPDANFVRALAQTVCRTLKVDARPVLDLLPPAATVMLVTDGGGLNAPFRERPGRMEPGLSVAAVRPLTWAAAGLVLAAVAVYFVPAHWWAPLSPSVAPAPTAASEPVAVAPVVPADEAASAAEGVLAAASGADAQPAVETAVSAPSTASEATSAAAGLVQLRSKQASWVEVRDAGGRLLLQRTVLPGESVGLDGTLPMRLVIGNAAATQLGFRGQPVDLVPRTRDNVARVELR